MKPTLILHGGLKGPDGNAFVILGKAQESLHRLKWDREKIKAFVEEATSGDYKHLLATVRKHFDLREYH